MSWSNSSGRIVEIEDVRATPNGTNLPRTYYFTYAQTALDPIPMHLSTIDNTIGTAETYTLSYNNQAAAGATNAILVDPFQ